MSELKIKRALISVSDKTGLLPFAKKLAKLKIEIISTGGTLKVLREAGIPAVSVDSVTGFPEILDGRVKTLHPKIHGGLLYRRDKESHESQAAEHGIRPIDLVVVNLYPFEKVTQDPSVSFETAIENIDIGGPSMLRSAAKNADAVTVICDPEDYDAVMDEMKQNRGSVTLETRRQLARKVFERTSSYDQAIGQYLLRQEETAPGGALEAQIGLHFKKHRDLRYGENPHQKASVYIPQTGPVPRHFSQLHGKELSYNNLLDIEATVDIMAEFKNPAACVVKHSNPSGIAEDKDICAALRHAVECDAMSAFGGIVALNRVCDKAVAEEAFALLGFFEVIVAPSFSKEALKFLQARKNLRIIETAGILQGPRDFRFLRSGGLLVQESDAVMDEAALRRDLRFVTEAKLAGGEIDDLIFAFKCVKLVKSNAIVITQGRQTVGIGAGQMSRVDSVEIACRKAGYRTDGGFLASDAFFPMPDSVEIAHEYKIRAVIQPGGSVRDQDVIETCDRLGIAMAFTGQRHFRH